MIFSSNNTGTIVGKYIQLLLGLTRSSSVSGGVIGGLAAVVILGLIAFYVIRRKVAPKSQKERPVNLLHGDPDDSEPPANYQPPPYMQPEPYLITAPTISSFSPQEDSARRSIAGSALLSESLASSPNRMSARPQSGVTTFSDPRSVTPELEVGILPHGSSAGVTGSRKSGMSKQLRAINIIQHEDAGPSSAQEGAQPETIELPPAYTNIRKEQP